MTKKKDPNRYTSSMSPNNTLVLDTKAIVTALASALVIGGILGAVGYSRIISTNTLRLDSQARAIELLEVKKLDKEVYQSDLREVNGKLDLLLDNFSLRYNN